MAWTEFKRVDLTPHTKAQIEWMAKARDIPYEEAAKQLQAETQEFSAYRNNIYLVMVRKVDNPFSPTGSIIHLSIRRNDRRVVRDWRHLQRIKTELIGPECEAVELFPAESRLMDDCDQYHLWALDDPEFRFPVGYTEPTDSDEHKALQERTKELGPMPGTSQRPRP